MDFSPFHETIVVTTLHKTANSHLETRIFVLALNKPVYFFQIVSTTFYDHKLLTAEVLRLTRKSPQPCRWVHVSGGEEKHKDRVSMGR